MSELTAAEAAARLGVKKATLYAYVSRGLLHRRVALDGRTSLFDAAEVDALRTGRRRVAEGELSTLLDTALTEVTDGALRIRGHDLVALASAANAELQAGGGRFEAVAELLWQADPPAPGHPLAVPDPAEWRLPDALGTATEATSAALPAAAPGIERLRVAVAVTASLDPMRFDLDRRAVGAAGRRVLGAMVQALPCVVDADAAHTASDPARADDGSIAARLWPRLTAAPATPDRIRALDAALALLADHGLASSTFAARIAASVRADPYSVVAAGLGVIGGSLHGAASAEVHRLLVAAHGGDVEVAAGDARRRLGMHPGFGHQVYRHTDPRCRALGDLVEQAWPDDERVATARRVQAVVGARTDAPANVDLALGTLTWVADMADDAGEVIFAISRTAGWLAHALEEYEQTPLRFRPRARFTGPRPRPLVDPDR